MGDPINNFFLDDPQKLDDPFADLARLREHRRVHRHEPIGQWFVFPCDDVRSPFADKRMSADRIAGFAEAAPASVRDEVRQLVRCRGGARRLVTAYLPGYPTCP